MSLILNTDVAQFLNITPTDDGNDLIDVLITATEDYAKSYCGRDWALGTAEQTQDFDGGTNVFYPKYTPVTEITSIKIDGDTYAVTDAFIDPTGSIIKTLNNLNPAYPWGVEIKYKVTLTAPGDLKHALVRWVSEIFKNQEYAGKSVKSYGVGDVRVDFGADGEKGVPAYVQLVLDKYRVIPGV